MYLDTLSRSLFLGAKAKMNSHVNNPKTKIVGSGQPPNADNIAIAASETTKRLLETGQPRFSEQEMERRRARLQELMRRKEVDSIVLYGANWHGSAVTWASHWPVTAEAVLVCSSQTSPTLLVQHYNHVPLASRIADNCEVRWAGESTIGGIINELKRLPSKSRRLGIVGALPFRQYQALVEAGFSVLDLNPDYLRLRLQKSEEEIQWLKVGAYLTDRAALALEEQLHVGLTGRDLADIVERAYVPLGGTTGIHYFGVTSMSNPEVYVPEQFPPARKLREGDVVFVELSAAFGGYAGQVLRTYTVGEPTELYRALHETADAAFSSIEAILAPGVSAADIVEASGVIEEHGFTICDDLVHGYGGGYLPPVLGSKSRAIRRVPDFTLTSGMVLVIQPNVVSLKHSAGVQTGEMMLITEHGSNTFHQVPRGLRTV